MKGALIHVTDRLAELIGHDDQHQRGRNDLGQRAGSRDSRRTPSAGRSHKRSMMGSEIRPIESRRRPPRPVVAASQGADEDDGIGEAAANGSEQLPDRVEQSSAMPDRSSTSPMKVKTESPAACRCSSPRRRVRGAPAGSRVGIRRARCDEGKDQSDRAERKCRRISGQQEDHQRREHDRRHVGDKKDDIYPPANAAALSVFQSPRRCARPRLRSHSPAMRAGPESGRASRRCA